MINKLNMHLVIFAILTIVSCQTSGHKTQGVTSMKIDDVILDTSKEINRYPSGAVLSGFSAKKQKFSSIEIPENASVSFYETGKISGIWTNENVKLDSFLFSGCTEIQFYENGKLKSGELADVQIIQGIEFCGEAQEKKYRKPNTSYIPFSIEFFENGNIKKAFLAKNTIIQGFKFKAETEINFYPSGQIEEGISAVNQTCREQEITTDNRVLFHENGMISAIYNDWGVGFFDESGKPAGHKQYLRQ